jgi:hypothetical protein
VSHTCVDRDRGRRLRSAAAKATVVSLVAGSSLAISSGSAFAATPCGSTGTYSQAGTTATCTYTSAGSEDTFAVPPGVSSLNVTAIGAVGGNGASDDGAGPGGKGAVVTNPALAVAAGATLYVDIGAAGTNHSDNEALCPSTAPGGSRDGGAGGVGCGNGFGGGGGGGSSDLSREPLTGAGKVTPTGNAQDPRLIVAGGGGGGGGESDNGGGSGGNAGGSGAGPGAGGCGNGGGGGGSTGGAGGIGGAQGGAGATCGGADGGNGTATAGGAGASYNGNGGAGGGGGGGGWFTGGGGSSGADYGGGGGGGAGSSYLGAEVAGASAAATIATAGSQAPSVSVSWTVLSLVFSGKISTTISGTVVSGALKITTLGGALVSANGTLVIQAANGDKYTVSVRIYRVFGFLTGQISVSGPGIHATVYITGGNLQVSNGLLTGQGTSSGFGSYTLSFTL